MSKARLVITAVVVEGRSQSELVARYRAEGEAAFQPRPRLERRRRLRGRSGTRSRS